VIPKLTREARIALNPLSTPGSNQSPAERRIRKEEKGMCPNRNRPWASLKAGWLISVSDILLKVKPDSFQYFVEFIPLWYMVSISIISAYEANETLLWLSQVRMSTSLISSISDIGLLWWVNSREQDSKQNFVNNIDVQAECFPIYSCIESDVWLTVHRNSVWIRKTN